MTGLTIGLVLVAAAGTALGLWLRNTPPAGKRGRAGTGAGTAAGTGVYLTCRACGHLHEAEAIRRQMYYGQRAIGDLQAASRGAWPLGRRLARRKITRTLMRELWR